jgi:hypothetical protein
MKPIIKILSITFLVLLFQNCKTKVCVDNIVKHVDLKAAISENISVPFAKVDTLIYDPHSTTLCGNSDQEFIDRYYIPKLDSIKYIDIIREKTKKIVFFINEENHTKDHLDKDAKENLLDKFTNTRVVLRINGELKSNKSVEILEQYTLGDQNINISKVFDYKEGWSCRTIKTEKSTK